MTCDVCGAKIIPGVVCCDLAMAELDEENIERGID